MNKIPLKTIIQSHLSTEKMSYESPETVSTDQIEQFVGNRSWKKENVNFFCKKVEQIKNKNNTTTTTFMCPFNDSRKCKVHVKLETIVKRSSSGNVTGRLH